MEAKVRLFYAKEAPGQHAAVRFANVAGPVETVALFRTERDAYRFIAAGNRSMTFMEELEAKEKREGTKA